MNDPRASLIDPQFLDALIGAVSKRVPEHHVTMLCFPHLPDNSEGIVNVQFASTLRDRAAIIDILRQCLAGLESGDCTFIPGGETLQ
jgi:hypothetical protein